MRPPDTDGYARPRYRGPREPPATRPRRDIHMARRHMLSCITRPAGHFSRIMPRGAALAGVLVGLLAGPLAAASGAATRSPKHHTIRCQHLRGHTILRRGSVRVFTASGTVYGCLAGRKLAWGLWESEHNLTQARTGSVRQVAGRFLAFAESFSQRLDAPHAGTIPCVRSRWPAVVHRARSGAIAFNHVNGACRDGAKVF